MHVGHAVPLQHLSTGRSSKAAQAKAHTALHRKAVKQLTEGLASPQPFRKVLEPAPELPLRVRVAALRHCCPGATDSALRRAVKDRGRALLTALHLVLPGRGPIPK